MNEYSLAKVQYIYFFAVIREIKNNTNPIILTKPSDE